MPEIQERNIQKIENKKLKTPLELSILGDDQSKNTTFKDDIQALASYPEDLHKVHVPKPPKGRQNPALVACVGNTEPADEDKSAAQGVVAHPVSLDPDSQPLYDTGLEGIRFDDQGMVLPHSILGSLEDFRHFLEATGETELVKRIPKSRRDPSAEASESNHAEAVESGVPSGHRNIQSNALKHWHVHMKQRIRQQEFLSDLLGRPVETLLMNQADRFRETQEQRIFLNQVLPLIHSGYGYHVGGEFWSLPQRYGDEMSGITATLTQTEQGSREPVTYVGRPSSILRESGILCDESVRPASRTWDQSTYLQHQYQELRKVLRDTDTKKPDISGLEVIGSGKPFTCVTVSRSPILEKEEEENEQEEMTENPDPSAQHDDVQSDALLIPVVRFCGQLASWTGNSTSKQGEVGISSTIIFEAPTGEVASSHLELHNEGSAAIFYSWQQLPLPQHCPNLQSQTKSPHFYFSSPSGVILPGDTLRVEFMFKSEEPGIKTELWQLNTHPVLLQGASLQVTLKGVALYEDNTADQRRFIEMKLEKTAIVKTCLSVVYEVLRGVHTPERPSSPAELYITEEQVFVRKNPKLQYIDEPVEALKTLWQEVNPGCTWDLSVDTLRQVVLSLPEHESTQGTLTREQSLNQLNSLLLQLSAPSELKRYHLTAAIIGQQLWVILLDTMAGEAMRLRNLLGVPEKKAWTENKDKSQLPDADLADDIIKDEKSDKKRGSSANEENGGAKSRLKDDNRGESKSPTTEKSVEESKKKGKKRDELGKGKTRGRPGKESVPLTEAYLVSTSTVSGQQPLDQNVKPEVMNIYTRLLHRKVYALMEDLVDALCDLMDERDEQDPHCHHTKETGAPLDMWLDVIKHVS